MKNRLFAALIACLSILSLLLSPLSGTPAFAGASRSLKKRVIAAAKHKCPAVQPAAGTGSNASDRDRAVEEDADPEDSDSDENSQDSEKNSKDNSKTDKKQTDKKQTDRDRSGKGKTDSDSTDKDKSAEEDEPKLTVTHHTITIGGKTIKYKATAGYMLMKDYGAESKSGKSGGAQDKGKDSKKDSDKKKDAKPLAKVFFIAYTLEDAGNIASRPVTFTFNGGPGSASIWLHMGGLGPRRAVLSERGEALPPPYRLEDNAFSWLDLSDLVFIDPVSTGYSRPEPGEDAKQFHGYTEDLESVGDFIRLYITKYKRWSSPKFIAGESYGTTRAAGLSEFLQSRYGIYLNGIVLVSTVLKFNTLGFGSGNDLPYALYLPTYASTAWYHKRLSPEMQGKSLTELLSEAEQFAGHDYLLSLFQGDKQSAEQKQEISQRLSAFTGLPVAYLKQLNNRLPSYLFSTHLLMDRDRNLGRYDSRFTGIRYDPGTDQGDFDPSAEAVNGTFTATFNDYVRRELHFKSELPYETLARVWPWSWKNAENRYLDVSEDLRQAMCRNPYLKVWLCCGHYDLATPYFASKYTVDQMALDPAIRNNVRLTYYDAGHMMYIFKPALVKLKADFAAFLKDAVLPQSAVFENALP
jgi:carboxypeptidase C (cathepsin A)